MPGAVAAGSWGARPAAVTESDGRARRSGLREARPRPPAVSIPASDGDECVVEAGGRFENPVGRDGTVPVLRCQVGPWGPVWEGLPPR